MTSMPVGYRLIAFTSIGRHKNHDGACTWCTRTYGKRVLFPCFGYRLAVAVLETE